MSKYGITEEHAEYVLFKKVCDLCGHEFRSNEQRCLDHNHETGKVRGVLCQYCNRFVVGTLEKMAQKRGMTIKKACSSLTEYFGIYWD